MVVGRCVGVVGTSVRVGAVVVGVTFACVGSVSDGTPGVLWVVVREIDGVRGVRGVVRALMCALVFGPTYPCGGLMVCFLW